MTEDRIVARNAFPSIDSKLIRICKEFVCQYLPTNGKQHFPVVEGLTRALISESAKQLNGPTPRTEFLPALRERFGRGGIEVEDGALETLLDLADDVPYNAQALAQNVFERTRDAGRVLVSDVEQSLSDWVGRLDPLYTQIWLDLSPIQGQTLRAVLDFGGQNPQSAGVARRLKCPTSSIQKSLSALVERDILRTEEEGGRLRYTFDDPFLAAWIRRTIAQN